jgi:hypothetical protein
MGDYQRKNNYFLWLVGIERRNKIAMCSGIGERLGVPKFRI